MAAVDGSITLSQQYESLQAAKQQKLARRKQKQQEKKAKDVTVIDTAASSAFGIDDDLDLKLSGGIGLAQSGISEELVEHLNEQIRELKDETGRLYKLLSERDFEIRQLRKKQEQQKTAAAVTGSVAGDAAATKIVDLSKKVRELTADLEKEKTRSKQLAKKCYDMENDMQKIMTNAERKMDVGNLSARYYLEGEAQKNAETELKSAQDKLRHSEQKATEFRNQCQSLRQELKMAQKVLSNEVGEGANVQSLLNAPSGWRGRAQQIIALQKKVQQLKEQLETQQMGSRADLSIEDEFMSTGASIAGSASSRRTVGIEDRQREQLRKMDKERKEAYERMSNDMKALEADHESVKQKWEASKARNKVLSNEVKALKQQLQTLLKKGQHDDELIQGLFVQQSKLKDLLEDTSKESRSAQEEGVEHKRQLAMRAQQESNIIAQLQDIVSEKESKVKALEEEIKHLQLARAQANGVNSIFERAASRADTETSLMSSRPPTAVVLDDGTYISSPTPVPSASDTQRSSAIGPVSARVPVGTLCGTGGERTISRQSFIASELTDRPSSRQPSSRKQSANGDRGQKNEELELKIAEVQTLYGATEVERDRLSELVKILEKRVEEATQKVLDSEKDLQGQKRKNVQLEKQLGKAKVESNTARSALRKGSSNQSRSSLVKAIDRIEDEDPLEISHQIDELQTSLEIQKDENDALKAALERTLRAKEEDIRTYNDIMEQTKMVFLQGLRQYRNNQTN